MRPLSQVDQKDIPDTQQKNTGSKTTTKTLRKDALRDV